MEHEFDSSLTCNYCGVTEGWEKDKECPVRVQLEKAVKEMSLDKWVLIEEQRKKVSGCKLLLNIAQGNLREAERVYEETKKRYGI